MIKPGTVVTLVTGGPKMTVNQQWSHPSADPVRWECQWFEYNTLRTANFVADSLVVVE